MELCIDESVSIEILIYLNLFSIPPKKNICMHPFSLIKSSKNVYCANAQKCIVSKTLNFAGEIQIILAIIIICRIIELPNLLSQVISS